MRLQILRFAGADAPSATGHSSRAVGDAVAWAAIVVLVLANVAGFLFDKVATIAPTLAP